MQQATDGEFPGDDGPLTPPQNGMTAVAPAVTELVPADSRHFGGGGVGWLQPTDAKRVAVVALPGGLGGGVAVPVDPAYVPGQQPGQVEVLRRRSETAEGPRAVGVAAAVLALLLAASSTFWALYKFKPGLIRDQPEVEVPPVYVVDQFFDTYRPPSPLSAASPTSPGMSEESLFYTFC